MTREQFDYMAENVLGSGTFDDGQKFAYYVSGCSVILQIEQKDSDWFILHEYQLINGVPTLVSEGVSK